MKSQRNLNFSLPSDLRLKLEKLVRRDLTHIRVHTDENAAALAGMLRAEAFTTGWHILFADGRFAPNDPAGMWLLAHEIAHTLQQSEGRNQNTIPATSEHELEAEADRVADWICSGRELPADFNFTAAVAGLLQCHSEPACPGTPVGAGERAVWTAANEAIEAAYKYDPKTGPISSLFFGSQFETGRDVLPPAGVQNRRFAEVLLKNLRGLVNQRRPDIIDFSERAFYEIKTVGHARDGLVQVESYYKIADEVRRVHAPSEPPWKQDYATWYPPHSIPLPTDALRKIVCTQATDHTRYPAVILYDVHLLPEEEQKKKRRRQVKAFRLQDHETQFSELLPRLKSEISKKVVEFDPENPEYVIIVPKRFYLDWQKMKTEEMIDKMRTKVPPFLDVRHPIGQFRLIGWTMVGLTAGALAATYLIVAASAMLPVAAAGGAAAAGGGTAAGGGATVVSLAAYKATLAAPAAKTLAAAAGVLIVIGSVKEAKAESAAIGDVTSIRAVPVSDFKPRDGVQCASSSKSPFESSFEICQDTAGNFDIHTEVKFDGEPYFIIARVSAE